MLKLVPSVDVNAYSHNRAYTVLWVFQCAAFIYMKNANKIDLDIYFSVSSKFKIYAFTTTAAFNTSPAKTKNSTIIQCTVLDHKDNTEA